MIRRPVTSERETFRSVSGRLTGQNVMAPGLAANQTQRHDGHDRNNTVTRTPPWNDVRTKFEFDGSWKDIYVLDTSLKEWSRAAKMIQEGGYRLTFEGAWSEPQFPVDLSGLFVRKPDGTITTLVIDVAGVELKCHFFDESNIEFDLDPRQVTGQVELDAILGFMKQLSKVCEKRVLLAPENCPQLPIFSVLPDSEQVGYVPSAVKAPHLRMPETRRTGAQSSRDRGPDSGTGQVHKAGHDQSGT